MNRIFYFLTISFLFLISLIQAEASNQSPRVHSFGINDGLPSHNLTTIKQDRDGVIWIATWNGLANFDGYHFNTYRSSDRFGNLSSNRLLDIEPDSMGNMWILTYDRGLHMLNPKTGFITDIKSAISQFHDCSLLFKDIVARGDHLWALGDGQHPSVRIPTGTPEDVESYEIIIPHKLPGGSSEILKVKTDKAGNEWLYTDRGLYNFTAKKFFKGSFRKIASLPDGYSYLFAANGDIYKYKKGDNEPKLVNTARGVSEINKVLPIGPTTIAAATDAGLLIFDASKAVSSIIPLSNPAGPADYSLEDINIDSNKRIWAFTNSGKAALFRNLTSPGELLSVDASAANPTPITHNIWVEDRFGIIWLAPHDGTLCYYDAARNILIPQPLLSSSPNHAAVPRVERSYVDNQNNLWLASTHNLNVINFTNDNFKEVKLVANEESRAIGLLDNGSILIGTGQNTIGRYDSRTGNFIGYLGYSPTSGYNGRAIESDSPVKFSTHIYTISQDRNRNIWIGTKGGGLFRIAPDNTTVNFRYDKNNAYSLPCDSVYDVLQDNLGNIWLATYGTGLVLAKPDETAPGGYKFLSSRNDLSNFPIDNFSRIRRLTSTNDGVIIASCTGGLLTFSNKFSNPSKINYYTSRHVLGDTKSLANDNVMQTLIASDGAIYVLPLGEKPQRIKSDNLLKNQLEFSPISTGNNIYSLMNALNSFGNTLGMIEDKNKNINFICESTIVIYDPATGNSYSLPTRRLYPNLEFSEAKPLMNPATGDIWYGILGGALVVAPDKNAVSNHLPKIAITGIQYQGEPEKLKILNPKEISVPRGVRNISIFFAALDYPGSDNIQYAYKFGNGDDAPWIHIFNSNTIFLNSLTPGKHKLTIRSTNADGLWQDNDMTVTIDVEPTFAESIWAKILWTILAIAVIASLLYIYTSYRRNRMLEAVHDKERAFFIEASHRLRTPLSLIGGPVAEVLDTEDLSEKGKTHLQKVHRNAARMLELVNSMLVKGFENADLIDDSNVAGIAANKPAETPSATPIAQANDDEDEKFTKSDDKRTTILIVEDNDDLRGFLRDILESQYNVATASNGRKGLEKAKKIQPDFIVTDITMPEMDGLTMVHKIKENKSLSHIPIIVLSAKASVTDRIQGLSESVDDYITKPFSATYLRQRIAGIIAQRRFLQQSYFEQIGLEMKSTINAETASTAPETPPAPPAEHEESTADQQHPAQQAEYRLESPTIADADQEMMGRLLKFIESRIADENLKIEELAESVNMGRTVFYGKIKALVGMSPSDFVRKLRMQRAEELIVKSKMNFSQIAYNVGFSDPKYFTKCFKKETGMTPSEYRQKSGNSSAAADNE